MTDEQLLFNYRLMQAEETLSDAKKMLKHRLSPRSIINRSYYAMFYSVLALFLKTGTAIKTSKHSGVISIFDRQFIRTGKIDKAYSRMLHKLFDTRQEGDYKEYVRLSYRDASDAVKQASEFIQTIKKYRN
ncbi:MAG: HEPN domain-containing protein [Planctomycetota bacterium]